MINIVIYPGKNNGIKLASRHSNFTIPSVFKKILSMKELIDRLTSEVALTEEQAIKAGTMTKDFAKEKFPLLSGAIEKVFTRYSYKKDDEDFLA